MKTALHSRVMENWWDRLSSLAAEEGLTWAEIGRRAGVTAESMRKYAAGEVEQPRGDVVDRIADALMVDRVWFRHGLGVRRPGETTAQPASTAQELAAAIEFGARLRAARIARGLPTTERAATGLAISAKRWAQIEEGRETPSLVELQVISDRVRESLDWLVSGIVPNHGPREAAQPGRPAPTLLHEAAPKFTGVKK